MLKKLIRFHSLNYRSTTYTRKVVGCSIIVLIICSIVFTYDAVQTEFASILPTNNLCGSQLIFLEHTLIRISARQEIIQQQMFILIISSIICFLICTLPDSIDRIIYLRFEINSLTLIPKKGFTSLLILHCGWNSCTNTSFFLMV
jgi:hypothetical protein